MLFLSSVDMATEVIALPGFEPGSLAPKASMIVRYTTGLFDNYVANVIDMLYPVY